METLQRFIWNDALNTGVPAIDVQHKELITAFNDLADATEQGKGTSAIKKLLAFLKYYAEWHFAREEKCAEECKCPFTDANKSAHQALWISSAACMSNIVRVMSTRMWLARSTRSYRAGS